MSSACDKMSQDNAKIFCIEYKSKENQDMTIKEIAELTGKNRTTVLRWVMKSPVQNAQGRLSSAEKCSIPADFSLDETLEILRTGGVSEGIMSLLRENALRRQAPGGESTIFDVLRMVVNTLEAHEKRINELEPKNDAAALLPPLKSSDNPLVQAVRKYSESNGIDYSDAWNALFEECYCRLRINFQKRASNEGITPVDYIEREGYREVVLSIANIVFRKPNGGSAFSARIENSSRITARLIHGGSK